MYTIAYVSDYEIVHIQLATITTAVEFVSHCPTLSRYPATRLSLFTIIHRKPVKISRVRGGGCLTGSWRPVGTAVSLAAAYHGQYSGIPRLAAERLTRQGLLQAPRQPSMHLRASPAVNGNTYGTPRQCSRHTTARPTASLAAMAMATLAATPAPSPAAMSHGSTRGKQVPRQISRQVLRKVPLGTGCQVDIRRLQRVVIVSLHLVDRSRVPNGMAPLAESNQQSGTGCQMGSCRGSCRKLLPWILSWGLPRILPWGLTAGIAAVRTV